MKLPNFQLLDFVETNRPRHEGLEHAGPHMTLKDPAGLPKPRTLIDLYLRGDMRQIAQDAHLRPTHYETRQHDIIASLLTGRALHPCATDREKNELFLTWQRSTELAQKSKEIVRSITSPKALDETGQEIIDIEPGDIIVI